MILSRRVISAKRYPPLLQSVDETMGICFWVGSGSGIRSGCDPSFYPGYFYTSIRRGVNGKGTEGMGEPKPKRPPFPDR